MNFLIKVIDFMTKKKNILCLQIILFETVL